MDPFNRLKKIFKIHQHGLIKLGTSYGGWYIPKDVIKTQSHAVCIGAGEDISFDTALNTKGMIVHVVDPTPRAQQHYNELVDAIKYNQPYSINKSDNDFYDTRHIDVKRLLYYPVGIWNHNGDLKFFTPQNPDHVSHSFVNLQKTDDYITVSCQTLETFIEKNNIDEISLLKIDTEGAEYEILKSLQTIQKKPSTVLVEYDELHSPLDDDYQQRVNQSVKMMKQMGYDLIFKIDSNYTFVLK